ncbi:hypothetical protein KDI_29950 [Dictyobacter arantiisoli]|uniref:Uncharacterized protein n=1 Tax=Dictyobacter arantiisoli TaxID=2014874 RepID=A0A5A5TD30_9CHLR|nr:hypothetical protein KDI_29950 [Dictyobacter arantiisoli]
MGGVLPSALRTGSGVGVGVGGGGLMVVTILPPSGVITISGTIKSASNASSNKIVAKIMRFMRRINLKFHMLLC